MDSAITRRARFGRAGDRTAPPSSVPAAVEQGRARAARAGAIAWAVALAADPEVLFLDTETTGLGGGAEVVDLAIVGRDGRVLLETLVRPVAPIPADASAIHGIRDGDVAAAPSWPELHDALCRLLVDRRVVVYNAAFDRRMVTQCGARHGLSLPELRWECAMLAYAAFHGEAAGRGSRYRWHKLERAARAFDAAPGGHRAAADALACRAVVLGMAVAAVEDDQG